MSNNKSSRRQILKSIAVGSGAVVAGKGLNEEWVRPVVNAVVLPAHAETTVNRDSQGGANTGDNGNKPDPVTASGYDGFRNVKVPDGVTQVRITAVGGQGGGGGGSASNTGTNGYGGGGGGGGASVAIISGSIVGSASGGDGGAGSRVTETDGASGSPGQTTNTTINVTPGSTITLRPALGGMGGDGGQYTGATANSGGGPGGYGSSGGVIGQNVISGSGGGAGGTPSATVGGGSGARGGCPPFARESGGNTQPGCNDGSGGLAGDKNASSLTDQRGKGGTGGAAGYITLTWL